MGIDYEFNDFIQFPPPRGDKLQSTNGVYPTFAIWFPSPCGDKLQSGRKIMSGMCTGFRPLAEYNFTIPHIESKEKNHPQEKREWSRKDKS